MRVRRDSMRSTSSTNFSRAPSHGNLDDEVLQSAKESWIADSIPSTAEDPADFGQSYAVRADKAGDESDTQMPGEGKLDSLLKPLTRQVAAAPYAAVLAAAVTGALAAAFLRSQARKLMVRQLQKYMRR